MSDTENTTPATPEPETPTPATEAPATQPQPPSEPQAAQAE